MSIVINAVKARLALLAIVNAVGLVLSGMGKISQELTGIWAEQIGNIFDWCVLIFGALAVLLPKITDYVRIDRGVAHLLMLAFMVPLMAGGLTACAYGKQAQLFDEHGNPVETPASIGVTVPIDALFPKSEPLPSPTPRPIMPAQTPILPIAPQLDK